MAPERPSADQDPPVSRVLTDRIRADPEMVEQVLNPDRTDENVRYRDPAFPDDAAAPDSIAAMKMARRTDAGLRQSFGMGSSGSSALWWVLLIAAAALIAVLFLLPK